MVKLSFNNKELETETDLIGEILDNQRMFCVATAIFVIAFLCSAGIIFMMEPSNARNSAKWIAGITFLVCETVVFLFANCKDKELIDRARSKGII